MRHRKKKGRLSRRTAWRKATLKCLAKDLLTYQRIETTATKAKVLRGYVEPLITLASKNPGSINARREVFRQLCDKNVVKSLFDKIAPLYKGVPGGYTRVMQTRTRRGDGAPMAIIELVKRTISDEDLLGISKEKEKIKTKAKEKVKLSKEEALKAKESEKKPGEIHHAAPEVAIEQKEEHAVEDVKREKAKTEQKKLTQKGFFKRFRRKSIG